MFKLLGGLKQYFKWQDIQTDNIVFRLHNTFTTALLLACSLIITATQYVGNPISCIVGGVPAHVVNTFCWISSTFTMPDAFRRQVNRVNRDKTFLSERYLTRTSRFICDISSAGWTRSSTSWHIERLRR